MPKFANFLLNNSYEVDAKAQEDKLRQAEPLLLDVNEQLIIVLKEGRDGRDKTYFTTHRILLKNGKGVGKKRKNFQSFPYSTIQGFAVTTAGKLDADTEVEIWGSAGRFSLSLAKEQASLFAIQQFLSQMVLRNTAEDGTPDPVPIQKAGGLGTFSSWISGDAAGYDVQEAEKRFKTETPVLLKHETVNLAFKTGRDYLVMTDLRILRVDIKGIMGKQIEFETISWESVSASTVATSSGIFDNDMEMTLHTTIEPHDKKDRSKIQMEFRRGKVDIFAVQKVISNHILGKDETPLEASQMGAVAAGNAGWSWGNLLDGAANRPMDPKEMEHNLRSSPPILQGSEHVELAFKGIRDMIVFTTKRLITIDPKGIRGKRVEYTSIPYKSMLVFAIQTAGAMGDMNTELMIWTDMNMIAADDSGEAEIPAKPGMSFLEFKFNKKLVDLAALKKYLSKRILKAAEAGTHEGAVPLPIVEPDNSAIGNFLSHFNKNQRAIDPQAVYQKIQMEIPILLDDERIIMAFQAGRDLSLFTNLRVIIIDVQGLLGKRVSYKSIPFTSILAFSVESAGSFDRDSELDLYTGNLWTMGKVEMDFRKGQVDILTIHRFLSAMILGDADDQACYLNSQGSSPLIHSKGGFGAFLNWLGSNSTEQDAAAVDAQLHSDPPLLMDKEKVEKVYKSGRDLFVYTSARVILVDVQGMRGKKVEYLTIPHEVIHGYQVETAGHMDRDAEVYLINDIPEKPKIQQDILVKRGDVMEMQKYLTQKLLIA